MIILHSGASRGVGVRAGAAGSGEPSGSNEYSVSRVVPWVDSSGEIPVVRLVGGDSEQPEYTWDVDETNNAGDLRSQTISVETSLQLFGNECLKTVVTLSEDDAGSMFFVNNSNIGEAVNNVKYMREHLATSIFDAAQTWPGFNTIDSARVWYKPPPQLIQATPIGSTNFHIGAYFRSIGESTLSQESDGMHFYYYYNIRYLGGNWAQLNFDTHPSHIRGASGSSEYGNIDQAKLASINAANTSTYGFFDLFTNVYFTERYANSGYPSTSYIDGFELYQNLNSNHDFDHIYCLWGGVDAATNELVVGWKRDKTEDDKTFDVRYAFSRFSENGGFSHGTAAPGGSAIDPPNLAGYNGVEYSDVLGTGEGEIDVTGQDAIYIAIQHEDEATRYAEIRIPLTAAGYAGVLG